MVSCDGQQHPWHVFLWGCTVGHNDNTPKILIRIVPWGIVFRKQGDNSTQKKIDTAHKHLIELTMNSIIQLGVFLFWLPERSHVTGALFAEFKICHPFCVDHFGVRLEFYRLAGLHLPFRVLSEPLIGPIHEVSVKKMYVLM